MLVLDVELLTETFEAEHDRGFAEWPPAPSRLFCALVSAHDRVPGSADVLRWLEMQPPPELRCSDTIRPKHPRSAFVVTNATDSQARHPFHPGRVAAGEQRVWPRSSPAVPRVQFVWPDTDLSTDQRSRLDALCRRVPYLGRATSPAVVRIADDVEPSLPRWVPAGEGRTRLGAPYDGYFDGLVAAFEAGEPSDGLRVRIGYLRAGDRLADDQPASGPFDELIAIPFAEGQRRLAGQHVLRLTSTLRAAVRSRGADIPAIHGHGDGPQVAFLALPFVGHEHADGTIGSVAVALPSELPTTDRRTVLRAVFGQGATGPLSALTCGPLGLVALDRRRAPRWSDRAERWALPSRVWRTATPVVLDRFPKPSADIVRAVIDSCELAGFPRPVDVEVSFVPYAEGGVTLSPRQAVRTSAGSAPRPLPYRHVRLTFAESVRGPMLVGSMRYYGVGLFAPDAATS